VSERVQATNLPKASSTPELGKYKESVVSCPRVLQVSFSYSPGFSLVLDPRCRLRGFWRKVGSVCEEFEDSVGGTVYLVNVSQSFGAAHSGSRIKSH